MAIFIKEEFNNGIEDCYILSSDNNKKIIEKTSGLEYNCDISIVKRKIVDYEESENYQEIETILEGE